VVIISYPINFGNPSSVSAGLTVNGSAGNTVPDTTYRTGYKTYRITAGTGPIVW
jgi:hypothetical protein